MSCHHAYCLNVFNSYVVLRVRGRGWVILRARNVPSFIFSCTLQHRCDHHASPVPSVAVFWFHLFQAIGSGEKAWGVSQGSPWLYQQGTVILNKGAQHDRACALSYLVNRKTDRKEVKTTVLHLGFMCIYRGNCSHDKSLKIFHRGHYPTVAD